MTIPVDFLFSIDKIGNKETKKQRNMTNEKAHSEIDTFLKEYHLESRELKGLIQKKYHPKEVILKQEDPLEYLYLIRKGSVKVSVLTMDGKELILCVSKEGEILGDIGFLMGLNLASTTVTAETETELVLIPQKQNREMLIQCAPFLFRMGKGLAEKLLKRGDDQTSIALSKGKERLLYYIKENQMDGLFLKPLSETAKALGISYRHIFRLMKELCQEGKIESAEKGYRILSK